MGEGKAPVTSLLLDLDNTLVPDRSAMWEALCSTCAAVVSGEPGVNGQREGRNPQTSRLLYPGSGGEGAGRQASSGEARQVLLGMAGTPSTRFGTVRPFGRVAWRRLTDDPHFAKVRDVADAGVLTRAEVAQREQLAYARHSLRPAGKGVGSPALRRNSMARPERAFPKGSFLEGSANIPTCLCRPLIEYGTAVAGIHPLFVVIVLLIFGGPVAVVALVVWLAARGAASPSQLPSNYGVRSPDGLWWWDGRQWQPVPPSNGRC
jgi:hypothetical protein